MMISIIIKDLFMMISIIIAEFVYDDIYHHKGICFMMILVYIIIKTFLYDDIYHHKKHFV